MNENANDLNKPNDFELAILDEYKRIKLENEELKIQLQEKDKKFEENRDRFRDHYMAS